MSETKMVSKEMLEIQRQENIANAMRLAFDALSANPMDEREERALEWLPKLDKFYDIGIIKSALEEYIETTPYSGNKEMAQDTLKRWGLV